jgi:hypothetical protein
MPRDKSNTMNYKQLFENLSRNPPDGWKLVHYVTGVVGGVYLWPAHVPHLMEPAHIKPDGRLLHFTMLFEFHVIKGSNRARILARTMFYGKTPKDDFRWRSLRDTAVSHCGGKLVKEVPAKNTASVALWNGGNLRYVSFATPIAQTADRIRAYLKNSPASLSCFINHL